MAHSTPFQMLRDGLMDFVERESELAKTELRPAARHAGFGTGFAAGAAAFLLHSIWMLVITLGFGIGWLLDALTHIGVLGAFTLGFLLATVVSIALAAALILLARRQFRQVKAPTATIEEAKATFVALTDAAAGQAPGTTVAVPNDPAAPVRVS